MSQGYGNYEHNNSTAYQAMRGVHKANTAQNADENTSIIDLAAKKAEDKDNKTAVTIALEDYSDVCSLHKGVSGIDKDNAKVGFFGSLKALFGGKSDNIFKSEEGQKAVEDLGIVRQNTIFEQEIAKNGGIKYANEGDDIYEAALNFAKADISSIEKADALVGKGDKTDKLEYVEINSYRDYDGDLKKGLEEMDLDGDKKRITPEEYASYLIATDGLRKTDTLRADFAPNSPDGLITQDEAKTARGFDNEDLKKIAQEIYNNNYAK